MKSAYKYTDGANEKFFDVLYIEDDGTMTLEHHNSQRTISWPARMEDAQFGKVVRYGKGSSIPFTDHRGNMRPRWSVLTAELVAEIQAATESAHDTAAGLSAGSGSDAASSAAPSTHETATGRTRRRKKAADDYGRTVPTGIESPSEVTGKATGEMQDNNAEQDNTNTTGENAASDETEVNAVLTITAILGAITKSHATRQLAKGIGTLAALAIIWYCGLLIPFALLGGVAAGVVK